MRYDVHFRNDVMNMIDGVVNAIKDWNGVTDSSDKDEVEKFVNNVVCFEHCIIPDRPFLIGGADGSGDFPCVKYGDSYVYFTVAMSRVYEALPSGILHEHSIPDHDVVDFLWLPEDQEKSRKRFKEAFSRMMGESVNDICEQSDYYVYKKEKAKGKAPKDRQGLLGDKVLILPPAHDADNIGIQLLTVAEVGSLVRLMKSDGLGRWKDMPIYLLEDTTLALPMVEAKSTLFFEIAKRYACVVARDKDIIYMTVSKSHNMPHMDMIEDLISKVNPSGEHWFVRIPGGAAGGQKPDFLGTRVIPPVGAVSYLFKLHKTTQPMRLDIDYNYWYEHIRSDDCNRQRENETQLFRDLDFASHDQRCYGYPYPIKACHDMASLTNGERLSMRKQVIDSAVKAGLKRKNFVDPEIQTGHS